MKLNSFSNSFLTLFLSGAAFLCLAGISSTNVMAQKTSREIDASWTTMPVTMSGNPTCADLRASGDPAFAQMKSDYALKLDQASPNGTFTFTNGANRELTGPSDPNNSVSVQSGGMSLNFTSTKSLTAIIVEGVNSANVYSYSSGTTGDSNLAAPGNMCAISRVTFCYDVAPTAAPAMLSGRIRDASGKAAARVIVEVTSLTSGETLITQTNFFGRYTFEDLPTGEDYQIRVHSGRYIFNPDTTIVSLTQDLTNADFVARMKGGGIGLNR